MKDVKLRRITGNPVDIERLFSKSIHPTTPEQFDTPGGRAQRHRNGRASRYIAATIVCFCVSTLLAYALWTRFASSTVSGGPALRSIPWEPFGPSESGGKGPRWSGRRRLH